MLRTLQKFFLLLVLGFTLFLFLLCVNSQEKDLDVISSACLNPFKSCKQERKAISLDSSKALTFLEGLPKFGINAKTESNTQIDLPVGNLVSPGVYCQDKKRKYRMGLRLENYWVLYNYILPDLEFSCNESITYTTHGDFTFFDNLEPLLQRWKGPLSLAVYAPGDDFTDTLNSILYYRECSASSLVREYVTVHIYFPMAHFPDKIPTHESLKQMPVDCNLQPDYHESFITYRKEKDLVYPVNIARNIARETAQTHYVFPSDIELYPSPGLIPAFLKMVANDASIKDSKRVYVNAIFEITAGFELPNTKNEVLQLLTNKTMINFHAKLCPKCHKIPFEEDWLSSDISAGMNVLKKAKRHGAFNHWEPIYIATNSEPWYDEHLSWEGRSDKMVQAYKMCLLDYEFNILDNAFLIHRPGIKSMKDVKDLVWGKRVTTQNWFIRNTIVPEVKSVYGSREGCVMFP